MENDVRLLVAVAVAANLAGDGELLGHLQLKPGAVLIVHFKDRFRSKFSLENRIPLLNPQ